MAERIRILFREQGIPYFVYWLPFQWLFQQLSLPSQASSEEPAGIGGWGAGGSPPKDQEWLGSLANALKMLVEKAIKAVKAIVVSILGAILRFLKKTVGFVA